MIGKQSKEYGVLLVIAENNANTLINCWSSFWRYNSLVVGVLEGVATAGAVLTL